MCVHTKAQGYALKDAYLLQFLEKGERYTQSEIFFICVYYKTT